MAAETQGTILRLEGELTVNVAAACQNAILDAVSAPDFAGLDLSAVTRMDAAGLQLLMLAAREAGRRGIAPMAAEPSRAVADVLALTRLGLDLEPVPQGPDRCSHGRRT